MNVTDGLRFKLDDLGVEWTVPDESWNQSCITYWTVGGIKWVAFESENNTLLLNASSISDLTPEQAIAATLGPKVCHMSYNELSNTSICLACGWRMDGKPNYCPNCGRRCVW